ncbi:hypothetical protein AB0J35_48075 [Nonomuraea angiospora]|uniref:hypothetical protein n=1 Tax=Nonomuraea angiospora TaxID=46172 RepID=UPI003446198F
MTEAQRLLRGPGSRTLYKLWHDLIRFEPGLLILVGEGLVPGLFRGEAERSLKPYMTAVRWEVLFGEKPQVGLVGRVGLEPTTHGL